MKLCLTKINKSYSTKKVLQDFSATFTETVTCCIMGPSGCGKTTLFRIISGLEKPDSGSMAPTAQNLRAALAFQENRLLENLTAVENIRLVTGKTLTDSEILKSLMRLLPSGAMSQPVSEYSGGMKRKVAICRALLAVSDVVILDEPFNGLDEDSKTQAAAYILEMTQQKILLFSTHQDSDANLMHAKIMRLSAF